MFPGLALPLVLNLSMPLPPSLSLLTGRSPAWQVPQLCSLLLLAHLWGSIMSNALQIPPPSPPPREIDLSTKLQSTGHNVSPWLIFWEGCFPITFVSSKETTVSHLCRTCIRITAPQAPGLIKKALWTCRASHARLPGTTAMSNYMQSRSTELSFPWGTKFLTDVSLKLTGTQTDKDEGTKFSIMSHPTDSRSL